MEKTDAKKVLSTFFLDMKQTGATVETMKRLLSKSYAELLPYARRKEIKGTRTKNSFVNAILPKYSRFALHIENEIVLYCCEKDFETVTFTSRPR